MKFSWKVHFNQGTNNYLDLKIDYSNIHTVKKANNFGFFFFFRFENWKIEAAFRREKIASNVGNIWNVWKPNNPLYKMGFKPTSKNRPIQGVQDKILSFFFQKSKYYHLHPILRVLGFYADRRGPRTPRNILI